jgi:hypothetical protein
VTIRQFHNADLPALVEIWNQHWSAIGPPPLVNAARFEQAVLARTFFDPSRLLLAEQDGVVQAWCHHAACLTSEKTALICAFCIGAGENESVADELLAVAEKQIAAAGFEQVVVGVFRDDSQGYAGLDPIGHGIGIPKSDTRVTSLLQRSGFSPRQSALRMMVSTNAYRPPVSRDALQLRRTSQIQTSMFKHPDPRHAAGMSHLDVESHYLYDRGGSKLASVNLWLSDPEAEVMSPSLAILDIAEAHQRGSLEPVESYLIGVVVQSLAQRQVSSVESAVDSEKTELLSQLQTLNFRIVDEGVCWEKSLGA